MNGCDSTRRFSAGRDWRSVCLAVMVFAVGLAVPSSAGAEVRVVATVGDLAAAVRAVGGDHVKVTTLARAAEDPHYVDAKPSYVKALSEADLLVKNGMALETGWLPTLLENARNSSIQEGSDGHFDASEYIQKMGVPDTEVTRKMGDVHPDGNPHYTLDPRQMARVGIALGKRLGKIDGERAETYESEGRAFAKRCLKTAKKWEKRLGKLDENRRALTVYHENWEYVTDWLGLTKVATVEPKPGVDPNPEHVADVVSRMKSKEARAILKMEYYPSSTVQTIADKVGVAVVTSEGHTKDGEGYVARIDRLARSIYRTVQPDDE